MQAKATRKDKLGQKEWLQVNIETTENNTEASATLCRDVLIGITRAGRSKINKKEKLFWFLNKIETKNQAVSLPPPAASG